MHAGAAHQQVSQLVQYHKRVHHKRECPFYFYTLVTNKFLLCIYKRLDSLNLNSRITLVNLKHSFYAPLCSSIIMAINSYRWILHTKHKQTYKQEKHAVWWNLHHKQITSWVFQGVLPPNLELTLPICKQIYWSISIIYLAFL